MKNINDTITLIMELMGTVAFAASGAMVGINKNMDIFGIWMLGIVTSVGGGILRDLILGVTPPSVFQNPIYVLTATITSGVVFLIVYLMKRYKKRPRRSFQKTYDCIMLAMDSIGLGIFTVVGVNTGILHGYKNRLFLLVFLGTVTGVGGGVIRDMMAGIPPYIFAHEIYACASMLGAVACVLLYRHFETVDSMILSALLVVLIRYLAVHYHWSLPHPNKEVKD